MMSTKNIIKYGLLWGLLIWAMVVRGQQVEILNEGEDPVWLSEQHQFVWDKVILYILEAGRCLVYEVHHAPESVSFGHGDRIFVMVFCRG